MPTFVSAEEFNEAGLDDWRYILGSIEATFVAASFGAGASFVALVGALADERDHHPDISLRYPGAARIKLTTHSHSGLTNLDVELAGQISQLAADHSLTPKPTTAERIEIAIDALDINAIRPFWAAVLGYREASDEVDGIVYDLVDPDGIGPAIWFQQMDEARPQRNRIHLDVSVPHDGAEGRVAAAITAGGVLLSDARAKAFWILADAEGNEACVCTWQDRG